MRLLIPVWFLTAVVVTAAPAASAGVAAIAGPTRVVLGE